MAEVSARAEAEAAGRAAAAEKELASLKESLTRSTVSTLSVGSGVDALLSQVSSPSPPAKQTSADGFLQFVSEKAGEASPPRRKPSPPLVHRPPSADDFLDFVQREASPPRAHKQPSSADFLDFVGRRGSPGATGATVEGQAAVAELQHAFTVAETMAAKTSGSATRPIDPNETAEEEQRQAAVAALRGAQLLAEQVAMGMDIHAG